jgi:hypothetical protein
LGVDFLGCRQTVGMPRSNSLMSPPARTRESPNPARCRAAVSTKNRLASSRTSGRQPISSITKSL